MTNWSECPLLDENHPEIDPRGLIKDAYDLDIGPQDARTIFLDWALGMPTGAERDAAARLLALYKEQNPDHPMTKVLEEASCSDIKPRRRAGRRRNLTDPPS